MPVVDQSSNDPGLHAFIQEDPEQRGRRHSPGPRLAGNLVQIGSPVPINRFSIEICIRERDVNVSALKLRILLENSVHGPRFPELIRDDEDRNPRALDNGAPPPHGRIPRDPTYPARLLLAPRRLEEVCPVAVERTATPDERASDFAFTIGACPP
jgi:hypothetical protein